MPQLDRPYLYVTCNGVNITADLSRSLISFTYTDSLDDADTLDISVEDSQQKWQSDWYPEKGAQITAQIGIEGGEIMDCGLFEVDEIEFTGAPDTVNIKCIAAGFKQGQKRSKKNHVHEGKTLSEIIHTVADAAGLKVLGDISDVRLNRLVQRQERDLRFLRRLARQYGYTFNVRGKTLVFIQKTVLEGSDAVALYNKSDLLSFSFTDKSTGTYKTASIKYHNPETSETVSHSDTDPDMTDTDDNLQLNYTAGSQAQAMLMTGVALREANLLQQTGTISLAGSPLLVSGNVIELQGLGRLSGDYIVQQSAHTIANDAGWTADVDLYKINYTEPEKQKKGKGTKKAFALVKGKE